MCLCENSVSISTDYHMKITLIIVFSLMMNVYSFAQKNQEQILKKNEIFHLIESKGYKNIEKYYFFNDDSSKILSIDSCLDMISIEQNTRYTVFFVTKGTITISRKIPNECKFITFVGKKILSTQKEFLPDTITNLYCNNELFDDLLIEHNSYIERFSNNYFYIIQQLTKSYTLQSDSIKFCEVSEYIEKFKKDYSAMEFSLEKYTQLHNILWLEFKLVNCSSLTLPPKKNPDLQAVTHRLMLSLEGNPVETLFIKNLGSKISTFKLENRNTTKVTFDVTPQFETIAFEQKLDSLLIFNYDNLLSLNSLRHIFLAGFKINKEKIPFNEITKDLEVFKIYANLKEANSEEEYYDFKKQMKEFNDKYPQIKTDVSKNYRYWTTIGF